MIRIFVIDDSPFMRKAMGRIFALRPDFLLVGAAGSGREGLERIPGAKPHVVTLDVEMPGMDGLETLKELMKRHPGLPVIMMSAHTREGAHITLDAIALGALDFIDKSQLNVMDFDRLSRELLRKIDACHMGKGKNFSWEKDRPPPLPMFRLPADKLRPSALPSLDWTAYDLCVIGASTGGPPALQAIVEALPARFPLPLAVVQHMPVGFTKPFADRLNGLGDIRVREARERDTLEPGLMLVAPAGAHLHIEPDLTTTVSLDPLDAKYIPSVDVMMTSAVRARGRRVVGVLLTGMGDDGADGMLAILREGGLTLAESEESCVVFGMPRAAHLRGGVSHLMSLPDICRLFSHSPRSRESRP